MVDADREVRAMVLLALPFPPLPCVVGRVEGMELTGEEQVKTNPCMC